MLLSQKSCGLFFSHWGSTQPEIVSASKKCLCQWNYNYAHCKHMKTGKLSTITLKDSCFWTSQSCTCFVSDIRPLVISSTVCACVRVVLMAYHVTSSKQNQLERQREQFAPVTPLFPWWKPHRSQRGNSTVYFCTWRGWPVDLREWQTPGLNHHFDEAAWGWCSCVPVVRGLQTRPVCLRRYFPSLRDFLIYIFLMSCVFLFVSLHKCVPGAPRELKQGITINHLCRKAPMRR